MAIDNHNFRKIETGIFFAQRLDIGHPSEMYRQIGFSAQ